MVDKLGILVTSEKYSKDVVGITKAAKALDKEVIIFLTDDGVFLCDDPEVKELLKSGIEICVCDHGCEERGIKGKVKGMIYASQFQNAVMAHESDRFLVF